MEKIEAGHPLSQSTDFVVQNIETLKTLFPTIVKEGKIDIKELQALLGEEIETEEEYYRFTWAGKSMARREANKPSTATLRPDRESSKDWDTTQNIFIEGDNLEVLKLLQKSYANKIKMIYIDPPYNTGKDFVYKDNYNDNLGNYLAITGQIDEQGKRLNTNSESDGRYHSNWLNMMYPRLKLARTLLKEEGLIFISIDDNEITNLRRICDEIFGEENFVSQIAWRKTFNQSNIGKIANVKEYILLYSRNISNLKMGKIPLSEAAKSEYRYEDSKGKFARTRLMHTTRGRHKYSIETPNGNIVEGTWMVSKERLLEMIDKEEVYWAKDGDGFPNGKVYLEDSEGQIANDFLTSDIASNQQASLDLDKLMEGRYFDFPKPKELIEYLIRISNCETEDIIIDFFAGSGTTAHAVMKLNSEESCNRKFICIQLPENTDEKSEAYKAGYKTISEITKERIRRAGEKIKSELKEDLFSKQGKTLDVGFRAFKLDSSNIRAWDGNPDALEDNLFNAGSNIKENRTEEDVLYEILLKYGLDLTMPIEQKEIAGKQVFNIGMGALFICLGDNITTAVAERIGKWKEEQQPATSKVIFKDTGFTDVEKTNSMQILKRYGIVEVNTI